MKCLVTGVAGFVGSHLAERLLRDGHSVVGVDALTDYYARTLKQRNLQRLQENESFTFLEADLNAIDLVTLIGESEWIFHQAGQAGVRASWGQDFARYTAANITATQHLLEAATHASRLKRFVYASSSSIYGNARALPVTEETLPQPVSPYGVTKLAGEHLCMLYWHNYHVPTVALRYFTVYGPRQRPDMAFHKFLKAMLYEDEFTVYDDGYQTRDFTYVADIAEANVQAAQAPDAAGQVFNIAGGSRVHLRKVIEIMEKLVGKPARIRYEPPALGDVRDTFADTTRAQHILGYQPRVPLREGLAAEIAFLRELYGCE
ncbi:MAG TPA: NAD-dependent epimerase/dehydratase family protein [Ktedonobacterales bacterium]|nr:NAD-dependent epimerase/dehydratase family protein [Ktedonobacterales bacterium]